MADNACRGGVGISGNDDLVPLAHPEKPQGHFPAGGLGIEAGTSRRAGIFLYKLFKFLCLGACGYPARAKGIGHFGNFRLAYIRRRKGYIHDKDSF